MKQKRQIDMEDKRKKGKKIKEVSREVGYIDYRNFSINFKK